MGSGHLMRCLTLADALNERGAEILFICRELSGNLINIIENKGYSVTRLQQPRAEYSAAPEDVLHAEWLGVSWQQDAANSITALGKTQTQWLIVDHYALDRRWEEFLRPHVGNIMVIDDLADRPHDCNILLDQNLYADMETRYNTKIPAMCTKLLGPRYALLRPEFSLARRTLRERDGVVRKLLVFFGGSDESNETAKALEAIRLLDRPDVAVDVIVGLANPHREAIESCCLKLQNVTYHCQVGNMAELMAAADLAIGAGGATTWERCALGLPSLVMVTAANQQELAETGARHGLFFYLGTTSSVSVENLHNALEVFLGSSESLCAYSAKGLAVVDAKGMQRVAGLLLPPQISIRRAETTDCDDIYAWRNAEETRRYIFGAEPIPLEMHRSWFCRTLENPKRVLLIGEIDNAPVGVLRYDFTGHEALISVYLVPGGQGQGVGTQLIRSGSLWIREHFPQIKILNAEIFPENVASVRAFEAAGYKQHHMIYKEVLNE